MIEVVAVALKREDGRVLMQRRKPGATHGGLWEFPGGKVEPAETRPAALVREVAEELGVELDAGDLAFVAAAPDGGHAAGAPLVLILYRCRRWRGEPQCLDAAEIAWFAPAELSGLATPPLDRPLIAALLAAG